MDKFSQLCITTPTLEDSVPNTCSCILLFFVGRLWHVEHIIHNPPILTQVFLLNPFLTVQPFNIVWSSYASIIAVDYALVLLRLKKVKTKSWPITYLLLTVNISSSWFIITWSRGQYFSPVFWSCNTEWRWLKVPRSTSCPLSRTWLPETYKCCKKLRHNNLNT